MNVNEINHWQLHFLPFFFLQQKSLWSRSVVGMKTFKAIYSAMYSSVLPKACTERIYQQFTLKGQAEKNALKNTVLYEKMSGMLATYVSCLPVCHNKEPF